MTFVNGDDIIRRSLRETPKSDNKDNLMERYRSGHNEAVLKTVCPRGRVGSNPTLCVRKPVIPNGIAGFCFFDKNCGVASLGEGILRCMLEFGDLTP